MPSFSRASLLFNIAAAISRESPVLVSMLGQMRAYSAASNLSRRARNMASSRINCSSTGPSGWRPIRRLAAGRQLVPELQDAWNAVSAGDAGLRALPGSSTVEYRFDGETQYSLPEEPGDPKNGLPYVPWDEGSAPTTFLDKAGQACASKPIRFQFVQSSAKGRRYLIAEADLAGLLRVVSQCRY